MRNLLASIAAALLVVPAAVAQQTPAPVLTTPEAKDVWTHAQPQVARVTHVALNLRADFAAKTMSGTAALDVLAARSAREIVLDVDNLAIRSVTDAAGKPLRYAVGADDPELGQALTVQLNGTRRLIVNYST